MPLSTGQPPVLTVHRGGEGTTALTGDELLREGARLYAEYITQRLADVSEPDRFRVVAAAERLRSLAG
jgi:hypothetical protein